MSQHEYMSRQEAAVLLRVRVQDVDRYISLGLLDRYRVRGRYIRVLRSQVLELAAVDPNVLRNA
jgi:excisionase family DNA binding protein